MAAHNSRLQFTSGRSMPVIGLGTHALSQGEQVITSVKAAVRAGYRHLDCAAIYRNEAAVGQALKELFEAGEVTREEMFITSKLWNTHHRPDMVLPAVNKCLRELGLEYVDLYLMHWPLAYKDGDDLKPKDENGQMIFSDVDYLDTWKAMEECVTLGKVRDIGFSNYNSKQMTRVIQHARVTPVALQIEANCHNTNVKLIQFAKDQGIVVIAFAPLGAPGKRLRDHTQLIEEVTVKDIAKAHNKTPAQIAIRYLLDSGVATIPMSTNPGRIQENFQVFDFKLSEEEITKLSSLNRNYRVYDEHIAVDHKYFPFHEEF